MLMDEWMKTHTHTHTHTHTLSLRNTDELHLYNDWTTGVYTTAALRKWLHSRVAQTVCANVTHEIYLTYMYTHTQLSKIIIEICML